MAAPQTMAAPQVLFRSPAVMRQQSDLGRVRRRNLGEVAGGATADVAAVACCFPCVVVELAGLAVYKVPAGICRKALKRNKRQRLGRRRKAMSFPAYRYQQLGLAAALDGDGSDMSLMRSNDASSGYVETDDSVWESDDVDSDVWQQVYANGFWRNDEEEDDDHHRFQH